MKQNKPGVRFRFYRFNILLFILFVAAAFLLFSVNTLGKGIIIDHTCTDLSSIPDSWITQVKSMLKVHYAHTSHGEQIYEGLDRLSNSNSKYAFYPDNCSMPNTSQYLSVMEGQYMDGYCETYITPEYYWDGSSALAITRNMLSSYDINVTMFAWCTQLDYYSQSKVQEYLNAMSQLESEYPNVTFVYFTGNAQSEEQSRVDRNNQIRAYCLANNKILFDFADLDCWSNGQQYTVNGIPMEHPDYQGDQAGHAAYASCDNKAKAYWWMLARIAGWDGTGAGGGTDTPVIDLDKSSLSFTSVYGGANPLSQSFSVSNTGTGTLNWSVSDNKSWLSCSPASGSNSGTVAASVDITGLSAGTYTGTITVSSAEASNSPQYVSVTLRVNAPGSDDPPFGTFDLPAHNSTVRSSVAVTGWVLDDIGVESVTIYRDENGVRAKVGDADLVEGARPDVEAAFPGYPNNSRAGWGYMMLTNFLPGGGNGTYTIYAYAKDGTGHETLLGTKTITCDNANAFKPFGAIETPTQGGTASGSGFVNWGWVLTPQPNSIPADGSTINVYVDGVAIGHPNYNEYRNDIATLFPDYANSNGAVGYFYLDTTAYEDGVYSIQWTATDSDGNTDGIGSRYFMIQNTGGRSGPTTKTVRDGLFLKSLSMESPGPVDVTKGYEKITLPETVYPNHDGILHIEIPPLQRMVIDLATGSPRKTGNNYRGYVQVGNKLKPLPTGSTLDRDTGMFYWIPGPGFMGRFNLVFFAENDDFFTIRKDSLRKVTVTVGVH